MALDIDIAHVARLARLALSDAELERYGAQLGVILEHAARVQEVEVSATAGGVHPLGLTNAFRDDVVRPSLDRDEVLSEAPAARDGMFLVPPAVDLG